MTQTLSYSIKYWWISILLFLVIGLPLKIQAQEPLSDRDSAEIYFKQQKYTKALHLFEKVYTNLNAQGQVCDTLVLDRLVQCGEFLILPEKIYYYNSLMDSSCMNLSESQRLMIMNYYSRYYFHKGEYQKSIDIINELLQRNLHKRVWDSSNVDFLYIRFNLGQTLQNQNQYNQSIVVYDELISYYEKNNIYNSDYLQCLIENSDNYLELRDYGKCEYYLNKGIEVNHKFIKSDHFAEEIEGHLLYFYNYSGQYAKAEIIYNNRLSMILKKYGMYSNQYATNLFGYGTTLTYLGKKNEAIDVFEKTLNIFSEIDIKMSSIYNAKNFLAYLYNSVGQNLKSTKMYDETILLMENDGQTKSRMYLDLIKNRMLISINNKETNVSLSCLI